MKYLNTAILLSGVISILMSTEVSLAEALPDSDEIYIKSIRHFGDGCRQGSVAYDVSTDGQAFTILFDDFIVDANGRRASKQCELEIGMNAPRGWTFALVSLDFAGFADIDSMSKGSQQIEYRFGRTAGITKLAPVKVQGPFSDDYLISANFPTENLAWAPCYARTKTLKIKSKITIEAKEAHEIVRDSSNGRRAIGSAGGYITVDSLDGEMTQEYGLVWKICDERLIPKEYVNIYRMSNGRNHIMGTSKNEGSLFGIQIYQVEAGKGFTLYGKEQPDSRALYKCGRGRDVFLSTDKMCEGNSRLGKVGYLQTEHRQNLKKLYRCYNPDIKDHFSTVDLSECQINGYHKQKQLGWVYPKNI